MRPFMIPIISSRPSPPWPLWWKKVEMAALHLASQPWLRDFCWVKREAWSLLPGRVGMCWVHDVQWCRSESWIQHCHMVISTSFYYLIMRSSRFWMWKLGLAARWVLPVLCLPDPCYWKIDALPAPWNFTPAEATRKSMDSESRHRSTPPCARCISAVVVGAQPRHRGHQQWSMSAATQWCGGLVGADGRGRARTFWCWGRCSDGTCGAGNKNFPKECHKVIKVNNSCWNT